MATLAFQQWNLENGELLLKSQSIGNGQTIEGTDTLRIDKLNADSLERAASPSQKPETDRKIFGKQIALTNRVNRNSEQAI